VTVTDAPLPVLLLGLLFGIQHATDADHVIAVATIVARTRRFGAGALVGTFWGVGHSVTMTAVGLAVVVFNVTVTPRVALSLELTAALMLILLGALRIVWVFHDSDPVPVTHLGEAHAHAPGPALHSHPHAHGDAVHRHPHVHPPARLLRALQTVGPAQALRSTLVGLVHGLAGSAAVALLVLSTIRSTMGAVGYLVLFGFGTILGMTAITGLLSLPFTIRGPRIERGRQALALATGALSLAFGLYLVFEIAFVDGLFLGGTRGLPR
jgi:high-affinity nickel-transport protein